MKFFIKYALALVGVLFIFASNAEDIDLYDSGINNTDAPPNILIILDNTANWNTPFTWEKEALQAVFNGLDESFNVGLMMYSETGNPNSNTDGGYVRYAVRPMNPTNRGQLATIVNGLHILDDKSNGGKASLVMDEAYRYFAEKAAFGGALKEKSDHGAFDGGIYRISKNSSPALSLPSGNYYPPITSACAKNYIIYISNGPPADNASDISTSESHLSGFGGNIAQLPVTPNGSQTVVADEWARFMVSTDVSSSVANTQYVTTYTVDVLPGTTGQGPGWTALLKSMAGNGGGKYFVGNDADTLADALNRIFSEIKSVNSVFAAVTLPVSVSVRGEYLNQIYMGVFRPDGNRSPRWPGNLKLYQLGCTESITTTDPVTGATTTTECPTIQLQGSDGSAVETVDAAAADDKGTVDRCAKSFWTKSSSFWSFAPVPNCSETSSFPYSDYADGYLVEKGGAAQVLRESLNTSTLLANRKVLTDTGLSSTGGTLVEFKSTTSSVVSAINAAYPATSVSVGLSRSPGNSTATGTLSCTINSTGCLSLAVGDTVTISDAGDTSGWNGSYIVLSIPSTTTFTIGAILSQKPAVAACSSGCTVSSGGTPVSGTSISRSGLVVTVSTGAAHGLVAGNSVAISGAEAPFNGTFNVVSVIDATTFTLNLPNPAYSPTLSAATADVGGTEREITGILTDGYLVGVGLGANTPTNYIANANVTISGVSPAALSGTFKIASIRSSCPIVVGSNVNRKFCYEAAPVSQPAGFTVTPAGTPVTITGISRTSTSGTINQIATVTTSGNHNFNDATTVYISGASGDNTAYNGAHTITTAGPATNTFTIPITLTEKPGTSGSGNATKGTTAGVVATDLINWVRGVDNKDDENSNSLKTDVRASVHGDVVHSRPVVVDYYTSGSEDVVVYYGGNDGMLHAIKGGTASTKGTELWSFVATEHFGKLDRLRTQTPVVSASAPKNYFFDGPITSYVKRDTSGSITEAYLFAGTRRGGRKLYAFDVTDYNNPSLIWTYDYTNAAITNSSKLGQTWSAPQVARIRIGTADKIAVIFGGGYDPVTEDPDIAPSATRPTSTMGNAVFVLVQNQDSTTGKLTGINTSLSKVISHADMRSIPGDVYLADITGDGKDDLVYAADTGGNVWRLDINDTNSDNWVLSKLFTTGDRQKFINGPVVALGQALLPNAQKYYAVMLGGGDREHPIVTAQACTTDPDTKPIPNWYYMIMDKNLIPLSSALTTLTPSDLVEVNRDGSGVSYCHEVPVLDGGGNPVVDAEGNLVTQTVCDKSGWKLSLSQRDTSSTTYCEKTVSGSAVASGIVFFNTNAPPRQLTPTDIANGICINTLGSAWNYAISFQDATYPKGPNGVTLTSFTTPLLGGGFAPSPVIAYTRPRTRNDDGTVGDPTDSPKVIICIGQHCFEVTKDQLNKRYRVYWHETKGD